MISIPGRIPIRIHPFFWVMIGVIGWINSESVVGTMIWAIVILFSVIIHEYGHALTAIAFGQKAKIDLIALGGMTQRQGPKLKLWKDFIIVLNGPLAGFLIYVVAALIWNHLGDPKPQTIWIALLQITMYANLFWTVVNLLPVHPLDGGRLLSIVLESIFGMSGVRASFLISGILALLIGLCFFLLGAVLAGALFMLLAFESYRAWNTAKTMVAHDKDETLQEKLKDAEDNIKNGNEEQAEQQLTQIREQTGQGYIFSEATEHLGRLLSRKGEITEAYDMLAPIQKQLSIEGLRLLQQLAFRLGLNKETVSIGERTYTLFPSYDTALTNALSYALQGQAKPAIGWLQRAISDGLPNLKAILKKKEFDLIRSSLDFQNLERNHIGRI